MDSKARRVRGLLVAALLFLAGVVRAENGSITVDAGKPGGRISPSLYGIFFEEINHAGDGGLYAELVRNRAFEDAQTPEGWSLVARGGSEGKIALDTDHPLHANTPHSLRLEIIKAESGAAGVANEGYWGMGIRKGAKYELSLHARAGKEFKGPLTARLESNDGTVLAESRIAGLTPEWKRYRCALTARDADPKARLVLLASSAGTVWFDVVSLFPEKTYRERSNGLRADLAGMLAELKPSFARFPGGCFVEGDRIRNAFRWKDTLGPIAERPGHWNLWGYRSTDGLGYHEYLQLCDDLGAEPMFVINCGMAHQDRVAMEELEPWVQDALDAIEYANGPADSKWGALRAKTGHPAPFKLKYLEIGNENGGPAYEERYAQFYKTIRAKYPEIQLIADTRVRSAPVDILDEHYYSSPEWFAANANKYDAYDRKGPRIYVGEYACTQNCGKGNLRAAVGEAAFMTGLERNADIVVMASYAPLFVNTNNRKWNPDAICFDSAASYGTPSYWVQQMFSRNRGDLILPCEVNSPRTATPVVGRIGLGTWLTQAEFADVKVTQGDKTLFAPDFSAGVRDWRILAGEWKAENGAFRQTGQGDNLTAVAGDTAWKDYTYTLRARKLGGNEGFLIMFGVRDPRNWFWWNLGGWGNSRHAIEQCRGGAKSELGSSVGGRIETGRWYDIKIVVSGERIQCYLDGKLIHDVRNAGAPPLAASASQAGKGGEIILKVANSSSSAQETKMTLNGVKSVARRGEAVVLTSGDPNDENSFEEPRKVAPANRAVEGLGSQFDYTFPPYSVTILRLRTQGK